MHCEAPVDVKTICSTSTAGVLVVAPSQNKSWIIPPWELDTQQDWTVPDAVALFFLENLKHPTRERIAKRKEGAISEPRLDGEWTIGMDEGIALAKAKQCLEGNDIAGDQAKSAGLVQLCPDRDSKFHRRNDNQSYFLTGPSRKCTYRDEPHDDNNFALVFCQNGEIAYWCFGAKSSASCQEEYNKRKQDRSLGSIVVGRWYDPITLDVDSPNSDLEFKLDICKVLTDEWDKLMAQKDGKRDIQRAATIKTQLMAYYNRFFVVVKSSKPCMIEVKYNQWGKVCHFDRRAINDTLHYIALHSSRTCGFHPGNIMKLTELCMRSTLPRLAQMSSMHSWA